MQIKLFNREPKSRRTVSGSPNLKIEFENVSFNGGHLKIYVIFLNQVETSQKRLTKSLPSKDLTFAQLYLSNSSNFAFLPLINKSYCIDTIAMQSRHLFLVSLFIAKIL